MRTAVTITLASQVMPVLCFARGAGGLHVPAMRRQSRRYTNDDPSLLLRSHNNVWLLRRSVGTRIYRMYSYVLYCLLSALEKGKKPGDSLIMSFKKILEYNILCGSWEKQLLFSLFLVFLILGRSILNRNCPYRPFLNPFIKNGWTTLRLVWGGGGQ